MKNIYIYLYLWDLGPFNNHSGSISIYMLIIQRMIFVHVWEVLDDHLPNQRYQSVSELRPHHYGDIGTTRTITSSSYMGHDVKQIITFLDIWGPLAMPGGGLQ